MEGFKVQSLLLTGSDRGIGLGLVQQFLELPHPPQLLFAACCHPDGPEGQALKEMAARYANVSNVVLLHLDVTDLHSIKEAAKKVEEQTAGCGLNLLINSADIACTTTLDTEHASSMAAVYATNTIGPMQVCQVFLPLLKRASWRGTWFEMSCHKAAIVNISSSYGSLSCVEGWGKKQDISYRCSKAALNMLTKCQSLGYGFWGILCVAIHPGDVKTYLGAEQDVQTMDSSIRGVVEVLSGLSTKDNGTFLDSRGQIVPW